jgi:hypothetical protein
MASHTKYELILHIQIGLLLEKSVIEDGKIFRNLAKVGWCYAWLSEVG